MSRMGFRFWIPIPESFFFFLVFWVVGLFLDLEQQSVVTAVTEKKLLQFNKNANFFFTRCSWLQFLAVFISFLVYIFYFFFVCVLCPSQLLLLLLFFIVVLPSLVRQFCESYDKLWALCLFEKLSLWNKVFTLCQMNVRIGIRVNCGWGELKRKPGIFSSKLNLLKGNISDCLILKLKEKITKWILSVNCLKA